MTYSERKPEKWARVTPCQLEMLVACETGDKHCGSARHLPSMWSLKAKGYIDISYGNWYSITQRGRDYLRFGTKKSPVMGERTRQMCQSAYALIVGLYAKVNLLPAAQEQPVENSPQLDDSRCAICGWPLAESPKKGCTRGNCSMRPWPDNIYDPARANKEYKTERFTERP